MTLAMTPRNRQRAAKATREARKLARGVPHTFGDGMTCEFPSCSATNATLVWMRSDTGYATDIALCPTHRHSL